MMLAHGGPGGLALEVGVVVVPVLLLGWFAIWNRRREAAEQKDDGPATDRGRG